MKNLFMALKSKICIPRLLRKECIAEINTETPLAAVQEALEKSEDEDDALKMLDKLVGLVCNTYSFKLLHSMAEELGFPVEHIRK